MYCCTVDEGIAPFEGVSLPLLGEKRSASNVPQNKKERASVPLVALLDTLICSLNRIVALLH